MKFLVVPDIDGQYVNPEGEHFNVIYGGFVAGPRASEFKEFDTLKHALEYYNLVDPNAPVIEEVEEEHQTISETESVEDNPLQDLAEQTDAETVVVTTEKNEEQEEVVISNEENTTEEQGEVEE